MTIFQKSVTKRYEWRYDFLKNRNFAHSDKNNDYSELITYFKPQFVAQYLTYLILNFNQLKYSGSCYPCLKRKGSG